MNGGDRQAAQGCQGYVDGRWPEKATGQVTLSPKEAARGCTKSASLKCGDKYVHLTLSIPAGVVYGEKLRYPQVNADDGAAYDATAEVKIEESSWYVYLSYISFIITALPALIALIVCLFKGFSFSSGLAWIIVFAAAFIASIVTSIISITRDNLCEKKYGPKTPEEKQRCEASRQTDVPQQLFELYQQESDQAKRMEYLKKSADQGYAEGLASMALCYSKGRGVKKNAAEAARWFQRLAQQNSPEAWYWLGRCYFGGWGVAEDKVQTAGWFRKAAEQGHAEAQYELGDCYYFGWGVEEDKPKAVQWYRKAADQDHKKAQLALADCYENGLGVPKDPSLAKEWREKAKTNNG